MLLESAIAICAMKCTVYSIHHTQSYHTLDIFQRYRQSLSLLFFVSNSQIKTSTRNKSSRVTTCSRQLQKSSLHFI